MVGEIVKIIAKIVQGINNDYSLEQVENSIKTAGKVNKNTVAAAYSWIYEKMMRDGFLEREMPAQRYTGLRFLSEDEKYEIGLENYDYLLHYFNIGMLNKKEFSTIIEQMKLFPEGTVDKENINILILSMFLDMNNFSTPGSRNLLYSSDTIN